MSERVEDHGWLECSVAYQRRLAQTTDQIERLRLLAASPTFSFWTDIRTEMLMAAAEIRALRARVAALEAEDA